MIGTLHKTSALPKLLGGDDSIDHIYCQCDSNVSLCGFDISDLTDCGYGDPASAEFCIVCLEVEENNTPCFLCGETL